MRIATPRSRQRPDWHQSSESERDQEIDKLLENWSNWARGGLSPTVEAMEFLQEEPRPVVDIEAAEQMECCMVGCKRERPALWAYVKAHYLAQLTNREGARRLKISVTTLKDRRGRLLAWVDGRWEEQRGLDRVVGHC